MTVRLGRIFMCKVSIIMPLYNAEKYVDKAIRSILNQSFTDFELIVMVIVNNCVGVTLKYY